MKRDQLEELGFVVKAELTDEDIGDYLFVVEDQNGDLAVLHFYLIENFTSHVVCHMADCYMPEETFIKNTKILKKGLTSFV